MATTTRQIGNITIGVSDTYQPTADQTQLYNAIGRNAGANNGNMLTNNYFTNRGKSIENAIGTSISAGLTAGKSGIDWFGLGGSKGGGLENIATEQMQKSSHDRMNDIAKKYGYNTFSDWSEAYADATASGDVGKIAEFKAAEDEFKNQADTNAAQATKKDTDFDNYVKNSYVSNKINQDRGKFAGSAIKTLSTGLDVAGLAASPLTNAIQGGVEGLADELEQNGLENFDWERAKQNALVGATTGAVTGALNKGITKRIGADGNLFKGNNIATRYLNEAGAKHPIISTLATGAGRGAISGAVGGATGAGLSTYLNGGNTGDIIGNALQGAKQGVEQGAFTGAAMAGVNMLPGVRGTMKKFQDAKKQWDETDGKFMERVNDIVRSGDSKVGNWYMNRAKSKTLNSLGNIGNSIKDYTDQGMGIRNAERNAYLDEVKKYYDEGGLEGAMQDAEAAGMPNESNFRKAQRLVEGGSLGIYPEDAFDALKEIYGDNFNQDIYLNKDGSWRYKDGEPYVWTVYKNKIAMALSHEMDAQQLPTTVGGALKRVGERIVEDANDRGVGLSVRDTSQDVASQPTQTSAWDRVAQEAGYANYDDVINAYLKANPNARINPNGMAGEILTWMDQNPNLPTTVSGALQRVGQRAVEDLGNRGVGLSIRDASQDMPDDVRNIKVNDGNITPEESNTLSLNERLKNNLRTSDSRTANILKNMPGKLGDKYNDWLAEPAQIDEFGPRYSQFSGDAEAAQNYLMRRQQGEVPKAAYNQSLQDVNGDGFVDYVYGRPGEGVDYENGFGLSHIQAKHGNDALARVPYNTENGNVGKVLNDRVYLNNDSNNDRTVIRTNWSDGNDNDIKKQWLTTNYDMNSPASRGVANRNSSTAGSSVVSDTGDAPVDSIISQNNKNVNPETEVYNALTSNKTSVKSQLKNAAGLRLQKQYGTIDKPTAKATNAPETLQKIADAGFIKPGDVERMSNIITGSDGEVSKLVSNLIASADPVNTYDGETSGQTIDDFIDLSIQKHGLDGISEGKAVKSQISALMRSLPSHAEGSITFVDDPTDVFKLTQQLDAEAANYEGRSGLNYGTTSPDKLRAAQVIKDVSNLYKDRIYSTTDVSQALTPEVAENLKSYAPNNKQWADYVDNEIMTIDNTKDLRSVQAPWVRAKKIIDNGYVNSMTYGGRNGGGDVNIPITKRGLIGAVLGATVNSKPGLRAQYKVLNKAADFVSDTPNTTVTPNTATTPTTTATNTSANVTPMSVNTLPTSLYNALGRMQGEQTGGQVRDLGYVAEAASESPQLASTGPAYNNTLESLSAPNTTVYDTMTSTNQVVTTGSNSYFQPTGDYWTDIIGRAVSMAIDNDDVNSFTTLYNMYQNSLSNLQKQNTSSSKLTATQQRANAAMNSLERIANMEPDLAYNLSNIPVIGNIATFGGNDYEAEAKSLAQQIGYMVSGSNIRDKEAENIGKAYVPQPWDNDQVRQNKLRRAYDIIQQYQNGYVTE